MACIRLHPRKNSLYLASMKTIGGKIKKYDERREEKSTYFREGKTSKMTLVSATKQHC